MASKSMKVYKRRLEVKKLYIQGVSIDEIAYQVGASEATVKRDVRQINKEYIAQVQNNPHILEKQAEYILRHLDELKLVKEKLWKIEETASEKNKISALKAIVDELNHEARVLKLIEVSKKITNYVHVDQLNVIAKEVVSIIKEFVPPEQQRYALERLKGASQKVIDVQAK